MMEIKHYYRQGSQDRRWNLPGGQLLLSRGVIILILEESIIFESLSIQRLLQNQNYSRHLPRDPYLVFQGLCFSYQGPDFIITGLTILRILMSLDLYSSIRSSVVYAAVSVFPLQGISLTF